MFVLCLGRLATSAGCLSDKMRYEDGGECGAVVLRDWYLRWAFFLEFLFLSDLFWLPKVQGGNQWLVSKQHIHVVVLCPPASTSSMLPLQSDDCLLIITGLLLALN